MEFSKTPTSVFFFSFFLPGCHLLEIRYFYRTQKINSINFLTQPLCNASHCRVCFYFCPTPAPEKPKTPLNFALLYIPMKNCLSKCSNGCTVNTNTLLENKSNQCEKYNRKLLQMTLNAGCLERSYPPLPSPEKLIRIKITIHFYGNVP